MAFHDWVERQREYAFRLPRWLVGMALVSSVVLGIWCVIYKRGVMQLLGRIGTLVPLQSALATVATTVLACMIVLYGIARVVRPPAPTNLPDARVRR